MVKLNRKYHIRKKGTGKGKQPYEFLLHGWGAIHDGRFGD